MPNLNEATLEERLEASPAPRVTSVGIDLKIKTVRYVVDKTLTVCIIHMTNGFQFVGTAACVVPANYDLEIGKTLAYKDAYRQIWSHEGYLLSEQLHAERA